MTSKNPSKGTSIYDCPVVNGWHLFFHPLMLDQLDKLTHAVERERAKNPRTYRNSANAKVLASIRQLIFEQIPSDPTSTIYRQGNTLGNNRKHWFRAKFGAQRFRLFFRYSTSSKIIIYAWVNTFMASRCAGLPSFSSGSNPATCQFGPVPGGLVGSILTRVR